jgi:hypothetical protein
MGNPQMLVREGKMMTWRRMASVFDTKFVDCLDEVKLNRVKKKLMLLLQGGSLDAGG